MAFLISLVTPFNSVMGWLQDVFYGQKIESTELVAPPVFIIGHWRSGTTFLHELMFLDHRFGSPTTYQCFAPKHFLLTEPIIANYFGFLLPKQRPMDNMAAGWNRPQEDEFALLTLAAPTPYFRCAYPNDPAPYLYTLDMENVPAAELSRFERALSWFVKLITFKTKKRVLLKSPPHTGRIGVLTRMFPGAKFVHISRNPAELFPSTTRLWRSLDDVQGLYFPKYDNLNELVFECHERMYRGFERSRSEIPAGHLCEVRYEDLVKNPVEEVRKIYEQLGLEDFEAVRSKLEEFVAGQKDYKTNVHELPDDIRTQIQTRWKGYLERYGYSV